jgi:hypothetical protein
MAQQEWDEWGLSSGLPLADTDVTVKAMSFGFNNDIAVGAVFANFTFTDPDGEDIEQSFSVGKGWAFSKDGTELVSEDGKPKKLSKNSNYGILVQSALECVGGDPTKLGKGFRFASTWVGTAWHTSTVAVKNTDRETGVVTEKDRIVFTQRLGDAAPAAAASAPAADTEDPLIEELIAIAKEAESHEAFMDATLEDPKFADKAIQKLIMSTKPSSIWKRAGR